MTEREQSHRVTSMLKRHWRKGLVLGTLTMCSLSFGIGRFGGWHLDVDATQRLGIVNGDGSIKIHKDPAIGLAITSKTSCEIIDGSEHLASRQVETRSLFSMVPMQYRGPNIWLDESSYDIPC